MKDFFLKHPSTRLAIDLNNRYTPYIDDAELQTRVYKYIIANKNNLIVLEGEGQGKYWFKEAIEKILLRYSEIAPQYDLYSAEYIILKLIYAKDQIMHAQDIIDLGEFLLNFPEENFSAWGSCITQTSITGNRVLLVALNLDKLNCE